MDEALVEHYGSGPGEDSRLHRSAHGRLELLRTKELVRRALAALGAPTARVLDVGGGTGVHAAWLARDGHEVHVVDVVPRHVQAAATLTGVTAEIGDARDLPVADGSVDAVLLLGPLYHLRRAPERARALSEARRVLRPGGVVVAAGISRYTSLLELGSEGRLTGAVESSVAGLIGSGDYDGHAGFVPAHFHTAEELEGELRAAGWAQVEVYGVEGPTWPALDAAGLGAFDTLVEAALRAARLVEQDPRVIDTSAHVLAIGR